MANRDFEGIILSKMEHEATRMQREAVEEIVRFLSYDKDDALFLLTGFAGTGKTTLMAALVQTMREIGVETVLLAPTGRAAKVIASYSDKNAYTIHKEIYRQKSYNGPDTEFAPDFNRHKSALFIVDEASMISGQAQAGAIFGTGDLLEDLVQYVYSGHGCRMLIVGDSAQLPPVGCELSPALSADYLEGYGMRLFKARLTEVVRQDSGGILWNATELRQRLFEGEGDTFDTHCHICPQIRFTGFADIENVSGGQLIERLQESYSKCGLDDTIVVTRSNKRAGIYNNGIRARILEHEERLSGGDRVVIVKNNYYWVEPPKLVKRVDEETGEVIEEEETTGSSMSFIANGEGAVVRRFRNVREVYGFTFADVTLQFPDYEYQEIEATAILDTLQSDAPALTREQQERLFQSVWEDYPEIRIRRDRMQAVREDPLFNALQIKYGYAVTCHKAQGGQWRHVYIDIGYMNEEMMTREYIRWLYTALTRATEKVFMVNWPASQTEKE